MMTSGSCGGVAQAGPRRATSDRSSCRSTRHSTLSPPRASSGSVLNLQSVTKCANSSLVVHPLNESDIWINSNHKAAWRIMSYLQPKESHSICRMHHLVVHPLSYC